MGKLLMFIMTLLLISVLLYRNRQLDKGLIASGRQIIRDINQMYSFLFRSKKNLIRWVELGLICFAEISSFTAICTTIFRYLALHESYVAFEPILKVIAIIITFLIVHYAIGYVLLLSSKVHLFIYRVEDKNLKIDFLLSYAMISVFLQVLILSPEQFTMNVPFSLIGLGICYFLNLKTLLALMANPTNVKSTHQENISFSRVMIAAIFILILLILNLYLMVCLVSHLPGSEVAFTNTNNYFDLFYYTMITFTTVGYGDIIPLTIPAKVISMLISVTSVICISVFLSSILSSKDKINQEN